MNTDFRIEVGFFDHHKTRRLIAALGLPAAWALMRLWGFAAVNKPDGDLRGMTPAEIAAACHFEGDPQALVDALLACSLLDKRYSHGRPNFSLHDWQEHQPFVANAPARRESARKAAEARWKGKKQTDADRNAPRMRTASNNDADRNAPAFLPSNLSEKTPLPPVTPSAPPGLPPPDSFGRDRNPRRGTGGMRKLGEGAYVEPKGVRPKLSAEEAERMERYGKRRKELLLEMRAKHPGTPEAEIMAFVTAQLRIEGITA